MDFPSLPFIRFAIYLNFTSLALLGVIFFLKKYRKYIIGVLLLSGLFSLCLMLWLTPRYPTIIFASFFFVGGIILALCCMEFVVPHEARRGKIFIYGSLFICFLNLLHNSSLPDIKDRRYFAYLLNDIKQYVESSLFPNNKSSNNGLDDGKIIIVDVEKFIAAFKKMINSGKMIRYKPFFDAHVFELLLLDNVFLVRMNLSNTSFYFSSCLVRDPRASMQQSKIRIASYFEGKFFSNPYLFRSPPPSLFKKEMDDLYMLVCYFRNDPPISITFNNEFDKK
jgi:hypothetical protein